MAMTVTEQKFLMKSIWSALQAPDWKKDDLIDFGKAIFAKKSLKDMDDKTFNKIFPFLESVTNALGDKLEAEANKEPETNGEAKKPAETEPEADAETPT